MGVGAGLHGVAALRAQIEEMILSFSVRDIEREAEAEEVSEDTDAAELQSADDATGSTTTTDAVHSEEASDSVADGAVFSQIQGVGQARNVGAVPSAVIKRPVKALIRRNSSGEYEEEDFELQRLAQQFDDLPWEVEFTEAVLKW